MAESEFRLLSSWRVTGDIAQVYDILARPGDFVRWWPEVYLDVNEIEPGDGRGVGRILDLHTRGRLPYTLRWRAMVTEADKPRRISIRAEGDLEGRGEWSLSQDGDSVRIDYRWTVFARRNWMRLMMPVLKPLFIANHRWAMHKGELGLERELARLAASGEDGRQ